MATTLQTDVKTYHVLPDPPDYHFSFQPFIDYLKHAQQQEHPLKAKFYGDLIQSFEERLSPDAIILHEEAEAYNDLLQLVAGIVNPFRKEDEIWAISSPIPDAIYFHTAGFSKFMRDKHVDKHGTVHTEASTLQKMKFVYRLVFEHCYQIPQGAFEEMVFAYAGSEKESKGFYSVNLDTRFLSVKAKSLLPQVDRSLIEDFMLNGSNIGLIQQILPLSLFTLTGFSVITLKDVTVTKAIERIQHVLANHSYDVEEYAEVISSLKELVGKPHVEFGLLPFLSVNDKSVLPGIDKSQSIIAAATYQSGISAEDFHSMINEYHQNPRTIVVNSKRDQQNNDDPFVNVLDRSSIHAYAFLPVYYRQQLVGILEIFSSEENQFDKKLFSNLEPALPLVGQLLQYTSFQMNENIDRVIREHFTSLQPSVQWKFNEVAWKFLQNPAASEAEPIVFENVFPFYGAIDVRNSTFERNKAVNEDIQYQLNLLGETLESIGKVNYSRTVDAMNTQCQYWQEAMDEYMDTKDEKKLYHFLETAVHPFLRKMKLEYPETKAVINEYLASTDESLGKTSRNRFEFEASLQQINNALNRYFEKAQHEVQKIFPSYFAKFRTDGIEYDIYTGQSIAPSQPFDSRFIKDIRKWQLRSMIEVTHLTRKLLPYMPRPLETTQLIFVHSSAIDISFRKDERRFDVEGAYNIRYEIIKKRIDKIHIKGTEERLTQPGKIAMVYFTQLEAQDYLKYIADFQKQGLLTDQVEYLELDEIQGISGLKGLRVTVV
jgi:GAF domain-containing protein